MKPALILACLAFLPLTAQDNSVSGTKRVTVAQTTNGRRTGPRVSFVAKSIEENLGIYYLKGNVEINLGTYIVQADEAEYFQDSGDLQPHGNVHIKPAPLVDPRGASQFGIK